MKKLYPFLQIRKLCVWKNTHTPKKQRKETKKHTTEQKCSIEVANVFCYSFEYRGYALHADSVSFALLQVKTNFFTD